jgi:two-component system, NarL family, sensor histidine kinase DegS
MGKSIKNKPRASKTFNSDTERTVKEFYRKVLLLQEEEKKRISRDLHDETGQIVVALGAQLNVIEKELKNKNIEKALNIIDKNRTLLQEIASKMKFMAFNLRPPALDILGLSAVLREYFAQRTASDQIRIEFKENLKDIKLNENTEITLYRIVQEAITNISKHAKAKAAKVELRYRDQLLSLFVEDDGSGFDVSDHESKFDISKMGLRGIKERVSILNGSFSINSFPGKGTQLIITLPIEI